MKNIKSVTKNVAIALALAITLPLQAAELVEVEATNTFTFTPEVNIELAKSVKEMNVTALNIETSAKTILIAQNEKQVTRHNEKSVTLLAAAE